MTYSLLNAATVGYDLVRLPAGAQVARVLLTALRDGPHDLSRLAAVHPGRRRVTRWHRALAAGRRDTARFTLTLARQALDQSLRRDAPANSAVLQLRQSPPVGDLTALDLLIRREILDWTWFDNLDLAVQDAMASSAADVLCDAAASAYTAGLLPYTVRHAMAAPYLSVHTDDADMLGGQPRRYRSRLVPDTVCAMLDALASSTPAQRAAWRDAVDELRPDTTRWAAAMHQATCAVHVTGRVKGAATAQLLGVEAFAQAGFEPRDGSRGVWNAIGGCLQAAMVGDLLPDEHLELLVRPWLLALGRHPL